MRSLACSAIALLLPFILYGEDLSPPSKPLAEMVEEAVKPAKDEFLKAKTAAQEWYKKVLDSEMEKATKAGSLDDVQAIQKEKEEFAADDSKWKSATHKAAIKKYSAELDAAGKKFSSALDALMKEQVRKKNIELAAKLKEMKETGIDGFMAKDASGWINLIPLIDPDKDAIKGKWELRNGELYSDDTKQARIEIPFRPPAEYDFRVAFTRTKGNDSIEFILSRIGKCFNMVFGGQGNAISGITFINGKGASENPTRLSMGLQNMRKYNVVFEVRNAIFKVSLDGKEVLSWKTDYSDMSNGYWQALRDKTLLGVYSNVSPTIFHSIEIREVSGHGQKLR